MCREAELKRKFKAEDKVRYVKEGLFGNEGKDWAKEDGLELGKIYTIKRTSMDDENQIVIKEGITLYFIHPDHFELAKPQVGDTARCKQHGTIFVIGKMQTFGNAGNLYYEKEGNIGCKGFHQGRNLCGAGVPEDCLELISGGGSKMSKYEMLKKRIEGWDGETVSLKEIDDLSKELFPEKGKATYFLKIPVWNEVIAEIEILSNIETKAISFAYRDQCEKMEALRRAFKWLLEHSSIKKDKKQEEIDKLKKELEDFRERTDKEIKKLESSQ